MGKPWSKERRAAFEASRATKHQKSAELGDWLEGAIEEAKKLKKGRRGVVRRLAARVVEKLQETERLVEVIEEVELLLRK
jgi:hypothetical protein